MDLRVRQQVIRIPEVLSEIRKVKWPCADPVTAFLSFQGSPEMWVEIVQRGLFQRLRKSGFKYSGLIKRKRWPSADQLEAVLLPILQARSEIEIFVIGPSFDDLHVHIRHLQNKYRLSCDIVFCEVIGADRKLSWFWPELRKADFQLDGTPLH